MTAVFYPAVFHPEETGYSVTIPDIEGCFTQGETMDEAVAMAQDAIGLMLEDCEVCPKPSLPSAIHVDTGDFIAMIPFDMEESEAVQARQKDPVYSRLAQRCRRIRTHQFFQCSAKRSEIRTRHDLTE